MQDCLSFGYKGIAIDGRVVMMVQLGRVSFVQLWMPHPNASIPPSVALLVARARRAGLLCCTSSPASGRRGRNLLRLNELGSEGRKE